VQRPIACALAGLVAIACCGLTAASAQAPGNEEPIDLFARLMPVITHARCAGCHGAVNPFDGLTHGGGVIDADFDWRTHDMNDATQNRACLECHTAGVTRSHIGPVEIRTGKWKLAPRHLAFVGKGVTTLCQQFAHDSRLRSHLMGDELIGFAFVGRRGDATERADPPPMTRGEFLAAADHWLEQGWGKCGRWEGRITQTEIFAANYGYPMPGNVGRVNVNESAGSQIEITRDAGVTKGTFRMSGQSTLVQTMYLDGCTATTTSRGSWGSMTPADTDVSLTIKVAEDGSYAIRFVGPTETTRSSISDSLVHDCPIPPFADSLQDPPIELEWNPWNFTIRCPSDHAICQIFDPENPRLSGTMERVIVNHEDAADPQSRLTTSLAGISRADTGASLPVTVTTTWDLELKD